MITKNSIKHLNKNHYNHRNEYDSTRITNFKLRILFEIPINLSLIDKCGKASLVQLPSKLTTTVQLHLTALFPISTSFAHYHNPIWSRSTYIRRHF